ncbi:MAG: hypothetical protein NPIRA02_10810 [Nitrospirales bacterium]|nr:MAG: hypothetical protein NPIRA02_10810 [Nitrospirales bacterium]
MNKTEAAYALALDAVKRNGGIISWKFEPLKLRLADRTYYSPDFIVEAHDHTLQIHEVKGFMRDDAAVKLKVAEEHFGEWFEFYLIRKIRGGWNVKKIGR